MSGYGVLWTRSVQPPEREQIDALAADIAHRGPDRTAHIVHSGFALIHAALDTTPEAASQIEPLKHPERSVWLVTDARLDNRDELLKRLRSAGIRWPLRTDADLILAAYDVWGRDLVRHLVGDFSFVLVDAAEQRLLAVRDHFGIRPLFWAARNRKVVIASTLAAVANHLGHPLKLDEQHLVETLAIDVRDQSRTVFEQVNRLPAAHLLEISAESISARRYWGLNDFISPRLKPEHAPAALREAFDQAVRVRLRSTTSVFCEVSGGLDSSTVFGVSKLLHQQGSGPVVGGVSLVFPGDPVADETEYIDAVHDRWGDIHSIDGFASTHDFVADGRRFFEPVLSGDLASSISGYEHVAQSGSRVLLGGSMGDQTMIGRGTVQRDLLYDGGWRAIRNAADSTKSRPHRYLEMVRPLARAYLSKWPTIDGWVRKHRAPSVSVDHLTARALARLRASEADIAPSGPYGSRYHSLTEGHNRKAFELVDRSAAAAGIELRHPFTDLNFAKVAASVPEHLYFRGDDNRGLHRSLMADVLPVKVAERRSKAEFSGVYRWALETGFPTDDPMPRALERRGLINRAAWRHMQKDFLADPWASEYVWPVWTTICLEHFVRWYEETY